MGEHFKELIELREIQSDREGHTVLDNCHNFTQSQLMRVHYHVIKCK